VSGITQAHVLLGSVLSNVFEELRIGASLTDGWSFYPLHMLPDVILFELAYRVEKRRETHNGRSMALVRRTGRPVVAQHAGFFDLYAPVAGTPMMLVTGPFAVARPTSADVQARWRWLTGTQARAGDPELAHYLAMTLATPTFEGPLLEAFRRFASTFCGLLAARTDADTLKARTTALRQKLSAVRRVERTWETAAELVDERTSRAWTSIHRLEHLRFAGAKQMPSHAVVGLLSGREDEPDAIDAILRRDALQRACVDLARKIGGAICGRVGEHGVALLVDDASKGPRVRTKLLDIADRARSLARRFGFALHVGLSAHDDDAPLPARYQAALSAAEKALSAGQPIAFGGQRSTHAVSPLGELRRELANVVRETPSMLSAHFDRYIETIAVHCGYGLEPTRAHVEAGFDQILDALGTTGALDDRGLTDLQGTLERAARAETVRDLLLAYRRAVSDVEHAVLHPKEARQERSVRRATEFIREHLGDPLTLPRVARAAGFAPSYFSKLFARSEKTTFQRYVRKLRVERAKQMLETTTLGVERIGQLSGFRTRTSFHTAFRAVLRMTPAQYRARA
jgi:AraC-like DNA-binding protein